MGRDSRTVWVLSCVFKNIFSRCGELSDYLWVRLQDYINSSPSTIREHVTLSLNCLDSLLMCMFFFLVVPGIYLCEIPWFSTLRFLSVLIFKISTQSPLYLLKYLLLVTTRKWLTDTMNIEEVTKVQIISESTSHSWIVVTNLCWSITFLGFILHVNTF